MSMQTSSTSSTSPGVTPHESQVAAGPLRGLRDAAANVLETAVGLLETGGRAARDSLNKVVAALRGEGGANALLELQNEDVRVLSQEEVQEQISRDRILAYAFRVLRDHEKCGPIRDHFNASGYNQADINTVGSLRRQHYFDADFVNAVATHLGLESPATPTVFAEGGYPLARGWSSQTARPAPAATITKGQKELLDRVDEAYKSGDIDTLVGFLVDREYIRPEARDFNKGLIQSARFSHTQLDFRSFFKEYSFYKDL